MVFLGGDGKSKKKGSWRKLGNLEENETVISLDAWTSHQGRTSLLSSASSSLWRCKRKCTRILNHEVKLSEFINYMISHVENLKELPQSSWNQ